MLYRVEFDHYDPVVGKLQRDFVDVPGETGDEAAHRGRIAAASKRPGVPIRVVAVAPAEVQPEPEPEAPAEPVVEPDAERAALLAEAEARGVHVDKRWGVARLREALA